MIDSEIRNGQRGLAIITARGGSKRIPRKNCKEFLGRPIMVYSIEAALSSNMFDTVMVSTDDKEIAEIGKKAGAEVPFFRSEKTSDDFASTADVILEVLQEYQKRGQFFDYICCIYPTAPFVSGENLKSAMKKLIQVQADTVIPVVPFSFPPQRSVILKDGYLEPKWPENMAKRSQDLETLYHDCGQFYCMKVERFLTEKTIFMEKTCPFIMNELEVQDIDTEVDWQLAELKYKLLKSM